MHVHPSTRLPPLSSSHSSHAPAPAPLPSSSSSSHAPPLSSSSSSSHAAPLSSSSSSSHAAPLSSSSSSSHAPPLSSSSSSSHAAAPSQHHHNHHNVHQSDNHATPATPAHAVVAPVATPRSRRSSRSHAAIPAASEAERPPSRQHSPSRRSPSRSNKQTQQQQQQQQHARDHTPPHSSRSRASRTGAVMADPSTPQSNLNYVVTPHAAHPHASQHSAASAMLNYTPAYVPPGPKQTELTLFVGTWNLHAKPFPDNLHEFIPPSQHDLYVIGTEECEHSIEKSLVFSSKSRWTSALQTLLGNEYVQVAQHTLGAIHIICFVRASLYPHIHSISSDSVKTGIGNVVGNKGGVALAFNVGETSLLFVNSHFAAHQHAVLQRNSDFNMINDRLSLRAHLGLSRATDRFEQVVWCGDMNYRVNGNRRLVDACIQKNMLEVLLANDQLNHEREKKRVFNGFIEGKITFPPTYKYDAGTDNYDTSKKKRIPSYTDRILFKPNNAIMLKVYNHCPTVKTSDHRPVFATFQLRADLDITQQPNILPKRDQNSTKVCSIQ